jgi:O-antigen biosynthesis protein
MLPRGRLLKKLLVALTITSTATVFVLLSQIPDIELDGGNSTEVRSLKPFKQRRPEVTRIAKSTNSSGILPLVLAIVFPQFHRDPINDKLWGEGFTDWDNLRKAPEKNRLGFAIPRPTELGYYDLTDASTRKQQGELAREHGIDGFIFHHYWFYDPSHPGPTMHAPLEAMLKDGYPSIRFCLHWCASKWMNTWHGQTSAGFVVPKDGVLQKQFFPANASDPAIEEHYNWLRRYFHHPNYIKVQGHPVLMLYQKKPSSFPVLRRLRELAILDGLPGLYMTLGLTRPHPHLQPIDEKLFTGIQNLDRVPWDVFTKTLAYPNPYPWNEKSPLTVPAWCRRKRSHLKKPLRTREIAGIVASFDNTPRRNLEEANIWSADQPSLVVERFRQSLEAALYYESCCFPRSKSTINAADDDRFVVINSMNEWAEGMALEPSDVYGRGFLETVRDTKKRILASGCTLY